MGAGDGDGDAAASRGRSKSRKAGNADICCAQANNIQG